MTGLSPVHGRYIDRLCRIRSVTGDTGNPCSMASALPQRGCAGLPSQRQRRVLGQRLNSSLDGMGMVPIWQPAPAAGTNKASPPPREQDGEERNWPTGMSGKEQSRRPDNGTKRAQIGKASGYTHRSFRPDAVHHMYAITAPHRPAVTHPDTRRDKKETARRAAFLQLAGRFRRWWQVLGSNQGRRSRRFYSRTHRGMVALREIFGACGWAAGGGCPVCGAAFGVRAGMRVGLDGGGLPVTPAGLWDLSPFYSLALGPDPEGRFLLP